MADGNWEFYFTHDGEAPLVVALDLDYGPRAPVAELPVRVTIPVAMKAPLPNGLRSSVEAGALFALEDGLARAMATAGFVRVGRVLTRGRADFIFHGPTTELPALPLADYEAAPRVSLDPDWDLYRNILWPGRLECQQISNREVVQTLRKSGDKLDTPRRIDHRVVASDPGAVTPVLAALGFQIGEIEAGRVNFARSDAPDRIDEVTGQILDAIEGLDGVDYEGWGCEIVT